MEDYPSFKSWIVLVMLSLLLFPHDLGAQFGATSTNFRFNSFELPGESMGNHVQAMVQDSFGFLWFGSQAGLHRWDGDQMKTYLHNPDDSNTLASNYIECIYVGKDRSLWLGHWGKGLDRYNYETENFQHYTLVSDRDPNAGSHHISEMVEDEKGYLWVATQNGLFQLDLATGRCKHFIHNPDDPKSISDDRCRTLTVDSEGTLWIGTGYPWGEVKGGLNRFCRKSETFDHFFHDPNDPQSLIDNRVTETFEDSRGTFWVGTLGDGLHTMDRETGKFNRFVHGKDENTISGPFLNQHLARHIRQIFEDHEHRLWIMAWEGGIKCIDQKSGAIQSYFAEPNNSASLPERYPWTMMQSSDGTLWASTAGPSASVMQLVETNFEFVPMSESELTATSFAESTGSNLWVSSDSGLFRFDRRTGKQMRWRYEYLNHSGQADHWMVKRGQMDDLFNHISKIVTDHLGRLWMINQTIGSLIRLDSSKGEIKIYQHDSTATHSIGRGIVMDVLQGADNRIWSVTNLGVLQVYDFQTDQFYTYPYEDFDYNYAGGGYFTRIAAAPDNKIWVFASDPKEQILAPLLVCFDPLTKRYDSRSAGPLFTDLLNEAAFGMVVDDLNNIWINYGTRLIKYSPSTNFIQALGPFEFGITMQSMIPDGLQRLWLFGDRVGYINTRGKAELQLVDFLDVRYQSDFDSHAFTGSDGVIYVGGKGGFQYFDPLRISNRVLSTRVNSLIKTFEPLRTSGQKDFTVQKFAPPFLTSTISLHHDQNAFAFRFAAMAFRQPDKNRHEFKLDGYDTDWRPTGLEPVATYVKVPPGSYTFKVRSATSRSMWGPESSVNINIRSPWWATLWAYAIYLIAALLSISAIYNFLVNRKLEKAEATRLKELNEVKTRLFTNMTHEFRTPLTVIAGMAERIKEDPKIQIGEGIELIQRSTDRLLELVNQMLDLSRMETGKMQIRMQQSDMISFIKYLVESLDSMATSKRLNLHFHSDHEFLLMDFDPEKLQSVMLNLLSNALKFTPEGGHIYVSITSKMWSLEPAPKPRRQVIELKIRDTGAGIPDHQISRIFDRFYQIDNSATRSSDGSGIGLALTKELIDLMGGKISVKSIVGQETEFAVRLPITHQAPLVSISDQSNHQRNTRHHFSTGTNTVNTKKLSMPSSAKIKILIIEDNMDVTTYISACLHPSFAILHARNGEEGILLATSQIPDLIITDVMMPIYDGYEVCEKLKEDACTCHIPIIMLTAKADYQSRMEGLQKGADAYLAKPFHREELLIRVDQLLTLRKRMQEYYQARSFLVDSHDANIPSHGVVPTADRLIGNLTSIVEANIENFNFTIEQFCRESGMSHSQLRRKIMATTGLTPSKFIRSHRLKKARHLLSNSDLYITAIAYDSGFSDPGYFSRIFKKEFGMTPIEFRTKAVHTEK